MTKSYAGLGSGHKRSQVTLRTLEVDRCLSNGFESLGIEL
jgi:hypothetical protein